MWDMTHTCTSPSGHAGDVSLLMYDMMHLYVGHDSYMWDVTHTFTSASGHAGDVTHRSPGISALRMFGCNLCTEHLCLVCMCFERGGQNLN